MTEFRNGLLVTEGGGHLSARQQIVRAAAESLLENGYAGTSVRAIAARAGVAIGNLQYHFPTQQELRRGLNQLTDPLEMLEAGVASIWDSLRQLGDIQRAAFDLMLQAPRRERL